MWRESYEDEDEGFPGWPEAARSYRTGTDCLTEIQEATNPGSS